MQSEKKVVSKKLFLISTKKSSRGKRNRERNLKTFHKKKYLSSVLPNRDSILRVKEIYGNDVFFKIKS